MRLARILCVPFEPSNKRLLWVTQWNIWSSETDLYLYYKLRQSCGDYRLVEEAPGHLFLGFETAEFESFLFLALVYGWDMYLVGAPSYCKLFVSHDEYFDISFGDRESLSEFDAAMRRFNA